MKKHLRWRYTCEFFGKTGGSAYHIGKHERGCTANPDRVCGMHTFCGMTPPKLADLCKIIMDLHPGELPNPGTPDEDPAAYAGSSFGPEIPEGEYARHQEAWQEIQELVEAAADGCPACTLAAYRALEVHPVRDGKAVWWGPGLDFKGMSKAFWAEHGHPYDGRYDV